MVTPISRDSVQKQPMAGSDHLESGKMGKREIRKWDPDEEQALCIGRQQGQTFKAIGEALGRSEYSVSSKYNSTGRNVQPNRTNWKTQFSKYPFKETAREEIKSLLGSEDLNRLQVDEVIKKLWIKGVTKIEIKDFFPSSAKPERIVDRLMQSQSRAEKIASQQTAKAVAEDARPSRWKMPWTPEEDAILEATIKKNEGLFRSGRPVYATDKERKDLMRDTILKDRGDWAIRNRLIILGGRAIAQRESWEDTQERADAAETTILGKRKAGQPADPFNEDNMVTPISRDSVQKQPMAESDHLESGKMGTKLSKLLWGSIGTF